MFTKLLQQIHLHQTIIIHRHCRPDGDALGSQIGLKHLVLNHFPCKTVYTTGDSAGYLSFMDDCVMDVIPDHAYEGVLAIIPDTSSPQLISDRRWKLAAATARMDHHIFQGQIAQTEVTDSGRFRYEGTTARTFRLAAFLREQDFDPEPIFRNLYAETPKSKQLRAQFVLKAQFTPKCSLHLHYPRGPGASEVGHLHRFLGHGQHHGRPGEGRHLGQLHRDRRGHSV